MSDTSATDAIENIKHCIDDKKSFCFNAGAGSGKTYSLVQTVNYILKRYSNALKINNQRIMVITYTNAAANEIVGRIGSTRLLDVSTIHTRMWELIKRFQTDLVSIHLEKIKQTIAELEKKMNESSYYNDSTLNGYVNSKTFQDEYYKYRTLKACELRARFGKYTSSGTISKVGEFKEYVNAAIKHSKLSVAAIKIQAKAPGFTKVEYDPLDNYDRLYKMRFSHDTLIEYSKILIEKSLTIKQIIIDTYPYILVDEFQDTNPQVVSLLASVDKLSDYKCVIGYYGDTCQNIYEDGVGNKLHDIHPGLTKIYKPDNRRSTKEIVELANRIRHDSLSQLYLKAGGSNHIYYSEDDNDINGFINKVAKSFPADEPVHCLVLKNDLVAERSGFGEFYNRIASTKYYKDGYDQLSTEVLSDDTKKLGKVPLLLYKWIKLYSNIQDPQLSIIKYIPKEVYSKINTNNLIMLRTTLKAVPCNNLLSYISGIFALSKEYNDVAKILKENIGDTYNFNLETLEEFIFESLYSGIKDEEMQNAKDKINSLLLLDFNIMSCWYRYITRSVSTQVQFHTFHGTKGLEYKNVIIVLTNSFNRKIDYYHSYFEHYDDETAYDNADFLEKRNLLYVAVTRAKENLNLLYVDPTFNSIKDKFESVFGESKKWVSSQ